MSTTICPHCGFSPIPNGAEICPKCSRRFVDARPPEVTLVTRTQAGGLTGAVTATPGPVVFSLICGAGVWLARGSGVFGSRADPPWAFILSASFIVAAMLLLTITGPAKQAPLAVAVIEIISALALGGYGPMKVLCVAHGAGLVFGTFWEPSKTRLNAGTSFASVSAIAAMLSLTLPLTSLPQLPFPSREVRLENASAGLSIALPPGWRQASQYDLPSGLVLPVSTDGVVSFGFFRRSASLGGVVMSSRKPQPALSEACQLALRAFGMNATATETKERAPAVFGQWSKLFELRTDKGGTGRFACGLIDGTLLALEVISDETDAVAIFTTVANGLDFTPRRD